MSPSLSHSCYKSQPEANLMLLLFAKPDARLLRQVSSTKFAGTLTGASRVLELVLGVHLAGTQTGW